MQLISEKKGFNLRQLILRYLLLRRDKFKIFGNFLGWSCVARRIEKNYFRNTRGGSRTRCNIHKVKDKICIIFTGTEHATFIHKVVV